MIKILNIISDSNIGGAGRCVLTFLKYFDRSNFQVKVVVPTNSLLIPEIKKLGIDTIEAEGIAEKSLSRNGIKILKNIIKTSDCDIVHTHGNMSGRIAAKQCGKKVVYTRHSVFPVNPKISKGIGKKLNGIVNMHYADDIIAVAEAAKENLTDSGIDGSRVKVILNGVEPQSKIPKDVSEKIKVLYNIEDVYKRQDLLSYLIGEDDVSSDKLIMFKDFVADKLGKIDMEIASDRRYGLRVYSDEKIGRAHV